MLEYAEEPFICWRRIQLNYLGEDFEPEDCK